MGNQTVNNDWRNPAVREENAKLDLRKLDVTYMATLNGTVLDVDGSFKYLEKEYRLKPRVSLWECRKGMPRKLVRNGTSHF